MSVGTMPWKGSHASAAQRSGGNASEAHVTISDTVPDVPYIVEAEGLTKEFKGFAAVKNVNLKIRRHTIHALIGPNGAGKTTCFNLITKFL
ncbi:ATP-binding cassette domain-containing protein, partial [Azorhizobium oxalatiphilum]|uniref:ATP-binding cassette domain-containing protein n=1 Tax=Azorhizobium oxalatiphilum TaxID=980631 RepID=UPI001FCEB9DD